MFSTPETKVQLLLNTQSKCRHVGPTCLWLRGYDASQSTTKQWIRPRFRNVSLLLGATLYQCSESSTASPPIWH